MPRSLVGCRGWRQDSPVPHSNRYDVAHNRIDMSPFKTTPLHVSAGCGLREPRSLSGRSAADGTSFKLVAPGRAIQNPGVSDRNDYGELVLVVAARGCPTHAVLGGDMGSGEFLGEPDENAFRPAYVAEPVHVLVLDQLTADELRAEPDEPIDGVVDVVD
jgi:hypothetical protein